jgi:tRNA threonylcarbamoyladenosine modification (KEOPS) complex  Pcc1 subunit
MENNNFKIISKIEIKFKDDQTRDFSYNSFIPELSQIPRKRTSLKLEKGKNSIIFHIGASDITAFKAVVSEIINFGKILEKSLNLIK